MRRDGKEDDRPTPYDRSADGLVQSAAPAVIPLVAWIAYRERFSPRQALGLGIAALGVAVVVLRGDLQAAKELRVNDGDLLILLAVPCLGRLFHPLAAPSRRASSPGPAHPPPSPSV